MAPTRTPCIQAVTAFLTHAQPHRTDSTATNSAPHAAVHTYISRTQYSTNGHRVQTRVHVAALAAAASINKQIFQYSIINISGIVCCKMHVSHACHMHEPGTDARIWTCDVRWAAHIRDGHTCNIVWCICLSNTVRSIFQRSHWNWQFQGRGLGAGAAGRACASGCVPDAVQLLVACCRPGPSPPLAYDVLESRYLETTLYHDSQDMPRLVLGVMIQWLSISTPTYEGATSGSCRGVVTKE